MVSRGPEPHAWSNCGCSCCHASSAVRAVESGTAGPASAGGGTGVRVGTKLAGVGDSGGLSGVGVGRARTGAATVAQCRPTGIWVTVSELQPSAIATAIPTAASASSIAALVPNPGPSVHRTGFSSFRAKSSGHPHAYCTHKFVTIRNLGVMPIAERQTDALLRETRWSTLEQQPVTWLGHRA